MNNEQSWSIQGGEQCPPFDIVLVGRANNCLKFNKLEFSEDDFDCLISGIVTYHKIGSMPETIDGINVSVTYFDEDGVKLLDSYIGNVTLSSGQRSRFKLVLNILDDNLKFLSRTDISLNEDLLFSSGFQSVRQATNGCFGVILFVLAVVMSLSAVWV